LGRLLRVLVLLELSVGCLGNYLELL